MRTAVTLAFLALGALDTGSALAQPVDPYAPAPAPPSTRDVEIDTAVAAGLVARAHALVDARDLASARVLVTEALARQPAAPVAAEATALLDAIDAELGRALPPTVTLPPVAPPTMPVLVPDDDAPPPPADQPEPAPDDDPRSGTAALAMYGVLGGAAFGVAQAGADEDAPLGAVVGGLAGGLVGYGLTRVRPVDRTAAHLIGGGLVWGGVAGALFADVVSGLEDTTADDIAIGAAAGAVGGTIIGIGLRSDELTIGDAAVVDASALLGTVAAFQLGQAMAPPETEAYTLNGTLGALGGYFIGHWLARRIDVTPGRAGKVAALGVVGAAAPWVLWAAVADDTTDDDEQTFGLLSLAGLAGGVYFGVRWTRGGDTRAVDDDAPVAVMRRSSAGAWTVGGPALAPVGGRGRGAAVTLVAGAW